MSGYAQERPSRCPDRGATYYCVRKLVNCVKMQDRIEVRRVMVLLKTYSRNNVLFFRLPHLAWFALCLNWKAGIVSCELLVEKQKLDWFEQLLIRKSDTFYPCFNYR